MSRAVCPSCGAHLEPLRSASQLALTCSACGWNSAPARRSIENEISIGGLFLIFAVISFVLRVLLLSRMDTFTLRFFPFLIALIVAQRVWTYRKSWKALRVLATRGDSRETTNNSRKLPDAFAKLIPSHEEAEYLFSPVLHLPKPRSIRWSWLARVSTVLLLLFTAFAIWNAVSRGSTDQQGINRKGVLLMAVLLPSMVFGLQTMAGASNRKLLRMGEVTVGRVVCQETLGEAQQRPFSSIIYAFVDGGNRPFVGQGTDLTQNLGEGAPIAIFYDPLDPSQNIALECSTSTVKLPHE
jgi:hypothetical protein